MKWLISITIVVISGIIALDYYYSQALAIAWSTDHTHIISDLFVVICAIAAFALLFKDANKTFDQLTAYVLLVGVVFWLISLPPAYVAIPLAGIVTMLLTMACVESIKV